MKTLRIILAVSLALLFANYSSAETVKVRNYVNPLIEYVQFSPDDEAADDDWLIWDGSGDAKACFQFDLPGDMVPGEPQVIRIRVRKSSEGGNDVNFHVYAEYRGKQIGETCINGVGYTDTEFATLEFAWDADGLRDLSGANIVISMSQVDGGGGKPGLRRGVEISALEWVVSYGEPGDVLTQAVLPKGF